MHLSGEECGSAPILALGGISLGSVALVLAALSESQVLITLGVMLVPNSSQIWFLHGRLRFVPTLAIALAQEKIQRARDKVLKTAMVPF